MRETESLLIAAQNNGIKTYYIKFGLVCFGWILWHINHCKLFDAKCIFIHINSSILNDLI